jgi:hypothetical protein
MGTAVSAHWKTKLFPCAINRPIPCSPILRDSWAAAPAALRAIAKAVHQRDAGAGHTLNRRLSRTALVQCHGAREEVGRLRPNFASRNICTLVMRDLTATAMWELA